MHQWIEVFTGDLRHILKVYDESIGNTSLMPYFDVLMQEDEDLRGGNDYAEHLHKIDDKLWKKEVLNACALTIYALSPPLFNQEEAQKVIDAFNLKIKLNPDKIVQTEAIEKIEKKIKQIITTINIGVIQEKEDKQTEKSATWEQLRVGIHTTLSILPEYDCSVAQYRAYEKQAKAINEANKKRNG